MFLCILLFASVIGALAIAYIAHSGCSPAVNANHWCNYKLFYFWDNDKNGVWHISHGLCDYADELKRSFTFVCFTGFGLKTLIIYDCKTLLPVNPLFSNPFHKTKLLKQSLLCYVTWLSRLFQMSNAVQATTNWMRLCRLQSSTRCYAPEMSVVVKTLAKWVHMKTNKKTTLFDKFELNPHT